MKEKFKNNCKTLFKSAYNTEVLFERRKNSFIVPLLILIFVILFSSFPGYIKSKNISGENVSKNFPKIEESLSDFFLEGLDCRVENSLLVCDENASKVNNVYGETIKYTIIANNTSLALPTNVEFNSKKDTDNLIYFTSRYIRIRYVERDYVKEEVNTYEIMGDYSLMEGLNFKQLSQELANNPDNMSYEVNEFMRKTYVSTLNINLFVNISTNGLSLIFLIIIAALIIRSPYFFKFKKGFTFRESLKITLTAMLPILFISILFDMIGLEFNIILGFLFLCRIMYIYFKYIYSKKNNVFTKIYNETKNERYDIR